MKLLLLWLSLIPFFPCFGQPKELSERSVTDTSFKTKIVVHYLNKKDMENPFNTKFQQYQDFALENYALVAPPKYILKQDSVTRSYSFYLDKPRLLNIGYHEIYVEPNDSLDISYQMIGKNQYGGPVEKIIFNTPNSFIYLLNGQNTYVPKLSQFPLDNIKNLSDINTYFNLAYIDSLSDSYIKNIFSNNPQFKETNGRKEFLGQIMHQNNLLALLSAFTGRFSYFNDTDKAVGTERLLYLYRTLSNTLKLKRYTYYISSQKIYELAYQPKWAKKAFGFDVINADLKDYDTLTQQYFWLITIKNNLTDLRNDTANLARINSAITDPVLQSYASKYLSLKVAGREGNGYMTNELRNVPVYDAAQHETSLGQIFKNTRQPVLYFDFCGSWCGPCLREMGEYAALDQRKYDHSDKVRPIWIFFENNQKDWLKVIDKYHLNKENCFLVMDKKLQNMVSRQFGWMGEFPHHFIFSNEGMIMNDNANPLINLKESDFVIQNKPPSLPPQTTIK